MDTRSLGTVAPREVATAAAFGATVSVPPMDGVALFFVAGRETSPEAEIAAAGGRVLTRLPDARQVLAIVPLATWSSLRGRPGIATAGR